MWSSPLRRHGKWLDPFTGRAPGSGCGEPATSLWSDAARAALGYRPGGLLAGGISGQVLEYPDFLEMTMRLVRVKSVRCAERGGRTCQSIFNDKRRGSGPISPDPIGRVVFSPGRRRESLVVLEHHGAFRSYPWRKSDPAKRVTYAQSDP